MFYCAALDFGSTLNYILVNSIAQSMKNQTNVAKGQNTLTL